MDTAGWGSLEPRAGPGPGSQGEGLEGVASRGGQVVDAAVRNSARSHEREKRVFGQKVFRGGIFHLN
mgnify:CR=1 FL=1